MKSRLSKGCLGLWLVWVSLLRALEGQSRAMPWCMDMSHPTRTPFPAWQHHLGRCCSLALRHHKRQGIASPRDLSYLFYTQIMFKIFFKSSKERGKEEIVPSLLVWNGEVSQEHGVVWVGRDLKPTQIQLPCQGDTSHQPSLPEPSSPETPAGKVWLTFTEPCELFPCSSPASDTFEAAQINCDCNPHCWFAVYKTAFCLWELASSQVSRGALLLAERLEWLRTRGPPGSTGGDTEREHHTLRRAWASSGWTLQL